MRRIFSPLEFIHDDYAIIKGQSALHICKVLRMKQGSNLELFNGKGSTYKGVIQAVSAKEVVVFISEKHAVTPHPPPKIVLCQGLIKGNRFDWIIEKVTELGIDIIIPIITSRTKIHLHDKGSEKLERWKRIAINASEQSGRDTIPEITQPQLYSNIINKISSLSSAPPLSGSSIPIPGPSSPSTGTFRPYGIFGLPGIFDPSSPSRIFETFGPQGSSRSAGSSTCISILFWENEKAVTLKQLLPKLPPEELWCIIGPEGGFSQDEVLQAENSGVRTASLGSLTLRADTAPIATLAILRHTYPCSNEKSTNCSL